MATNIGGRNCATMGQRVKDRRVGGQRNPHRCPAVADRLPGRSGVWAPPWLALYLVSAESRRASIRPASVLRLFEIHHGFKCGAFEAGTAENGLAWTSSRINHPGPGDA